MAEVTTLVLTEDITVLGPPSIVTVQTDVGATGVRGSKIFAGLGNPNSNGFNNTETIELNDIYINILLGSNYSYMYQYVSQPGGNVWTPLLKINPTLFSKIQTTTFTNGTGIINIPISSITDIDITALSPENFAIQMTPIHDKPVAIAITSVVFGGANNEDLIISMSALEQYTNWIPVTDILSINLLITMVASA